MNMLFDHQLMFNLVNLLVLKSCQKQHLIGARCLFIMRNYLTHKIDEHINL